MLSQSQAYDGLSFRTVSYEYDSFGRLSTMTSPCSGSTSGGSASYACDGQGCISRGFDKETGLHYNYFRDYDPEIGRYAQSDPIGLTGGMNTYGYVFQTPLRVFDSLGLYAYGDIVQFWNHYCDGTGASIATSFASINWGDMDERARATIAAMVGQSCAQRKIPVSFKMSAQAAGADRAIIGRHVVQIGGEIAVSCDCTWTYSGRASSVLGYDPYDFDASNRGFIGEASVWIGVHRCPNTGRAFKIYLTGSKANTASGSIDGGAPTCCGN